MFPGTMSSELPTVLMIAIFNYIARKNIECNKNNTFILHSAEKKLINEYNSKNFSNIGIGTLQYTNES